jgi:hypothetical protein
MALSDSGRSIGAVSDLLWKQLYKRINSSTDTGDILVTIGRGEAKEPPAKEVLNLTLYEIDFDGSMKNMPCEGVTQPAWLVLKYLMTAFDDKGDSDSIDAHKILSRGIQALLDINYLGLGIQDPYTLFALQDNPEPLKITFDSVNPDLLSKLIQGTDEVFRVSVGFQVRPVLIASGEIPLYPQLVGIDYTKDIVIGYDGVQIDVSLLRQPAIHGIFPARNEAVVGSSITLSGSNLDLPGLVVRLGTLDLPVTAQNSSKLTFVLNEVACDGGISAGSLPVAVVKILPSGHRSTSNVLNCDIAPVLASIALDSDGDGSWLTFNGTLLGGKDDDIIILLVRDDKPAYLFDGSQCVTATTQDTLKVDCTELMKAFNPPNGSYRVVLRVNGQQASAKPEVVFP